MDAEFMIAGSGGTRTVAASDFFADLFETACGDDEILTEIRVPKKTGWGARYGSSSGPCSSGRSSRWRDRRHLRRHDQRRRSLRTWLDARARGDRERLARVAATEDGVRAAAEQPPRVRTRPAT
jgi:carbon-monoxide dehydrogenase medium subunit